jgi:type I restriction-modification system DNA methylase subunit
LAIQQRHDEAFDVEVVSKKFFENYAKVFEKVESLIQGIKEPEQKRLFTQKLFNRLMFIAFIQKKGWLKFNGHTDYLSTLWKDYQQDNSIPNKNFYRDRLSLVFFSGLNNPQESNVIDINGGNRLQKFIGTVPYLNGGLFEREEDDQNGKIVVPDECLDTILHNLFNRFNFTVTESTPLDLEVAVDPEMLGKVFEELVTARHESGSYYTPKPIVSFMCRQALKGYLQSQLPGELTTAIEQFVEEHNPDELRNPESVLEALGRVRVCDPACGSGAYLLGMLHELLDLRHSLSATCGLDSKKTVYEHKLEIIENNLYGVDIDVFAVNIARLRLWLSLAVEYEGDNPPPLPNLKFKIEVGDSLIAPNPKGIGAFRDELVHQYREAKSRYMRAHQKQEKQTLEDKINDLKKQISLLTYGSSQIQGFDWAVEFAEVFLDGGFDIQVANPPYVRQELITHLKPTLKEVYSAVYTGTSDLYCFFYARALQLLRPGGMLAFISSNKWFRANYGSKLKQHIAETCKVHSITDFGELPVFQSAATFPMIFIAQTGKTTDNLSIFTRVKSLKSPYPDVLELIHENGQVLPPDAIKGSNWTLTDAISANRLRKMESAGISLEQYVNGQIYYGVKTGLNRAFVINGAERLKLITQDPKSGEIIKPLIIGDNVRKWQNNYQDKWLIFTRRGIDINSYPAIKAYLIQWQTQLEPKPRDWSKSKKWLGRKSGSYKWYEIQDDVAYYTAFEKPKIVFPEICKEPRFAFDDTSVFTNNKAFIIPLKDLYLLGVLNSSPAWEYTKSICAALGDEDKGGRLMLQWVNFKRLPIPQASSTERTLIATLVQKCLDARGVGCEVWEKEIDERVAELYGL